jgi:hypothetical protein
MAVNRTDNNRNDTIRKLQDEYYAKETQSNKKHKAELQNLTEDYQRSVEELKGENSQKIGQLNNYMSSRLSKQEQEHQRQVAEVRDIYSNQMRKKSEESNRLYEAQGHSYESEIEKRKEVAESQRDRLTGEFKTEIEKKDQALSDFIKNSHEENGKMWVDHRTKMEKSKTESLDAQRKGMGEQITSLHREIGEIKKQNQNEENQLTTQNKFEKERLTKNFENALHRQEEINRANHEAKTRDFQLAQSISKEKFNKALVQKQQNLDNSHEDFRNTISERINDQISGLRGDLLDEKNKNAIDHTNLMRQNQGEKKHITSDYEGKLELERKQKEKAISSVNLQVDDEVSKAIKTRDYSFKNLSDSFARDKEMTKTKNLSQVSQLKNEMEERELHITGRADSRVGKANENLKQSEKQMRKFYEMNLDLIKGDFATELNNERVRNVQARYELENRLGSKIRAQEKELTHAIDAKTLEFDEKLRTQKDFYENEMRKQAAQSSKLLNERETYYKALMQSQDMRSENQISQLKETHSNETEANERKHHEELNALAQKISEKNRKRG